MKELLGNRMKHNYEEAYKIRLPARTPIIIRLDGKCFHTFTKGMEKPFDEKLIADMSLVGMELCNQIHGAQIAYIQSDEISILVHNYKNLDSQGWFDNEIQKIVSVSAGIASAKMSQMYNKQVVFDSRVFVLPEAEVNNYFVWRQQDAIRNSVSMLAQSIFPKKELHKKNNKQIKLMLDKHNDNWDNLDIYKQRGFCIIHSDKIESEIIILESGWMVDKQIPLFQNNSDYIEKLLETEQ